jgi:diacylglycerol kinase family enzyme
MRVASQTFVLNISAGLSARAMRDTRPEHKRRFCVLAYVWTIARDLLQLQPQHFNLTVDGHQVEVRATERQRHVSARATISVWPTGRLQPSAARRLYSNSAHVYRLSAVDLGLLQGSAKRQAALRTLRIRTSITVDALRPPQPVQADGK